MKSHYGVALCLVALLVLIAAGVALAGPRVAIVKGDDAILMDSFEHQSWTAFMPKSPEGGREDLYWTPTWTKESEQEVERMVRKAVELAGGWPVKKGDTVLIKANANSDLWFLMTNGIFTSNHILCTNTDARVLRAVALLAKESGAKKIYIAEAPGLAEPISAMNTWGFGIVAKEVGAEMVGLSSAPYEWVRAPHALSAEEYAIPKIALEADKVISVSPMKTHGFAGVTMTLKNVGIGIAPNAVYGSPKIGLRHDKLARTIVDVCEIVGIDYGVIGGIYGMEGQGPTNGDPVYSGIVIASSDPVAADSVGTMCMGFTPANYGTMRVAEEVGLGTMKDIEIVGNKIEEVVVQYLPPPQHGPASYGEVYGW